MPFIAAIALAAGSVAVYKKLEKSFGPEEKAKARAAINAARQASQASRDRVQQIIAAGRKKAAENRVPGHPWWVRNLGKATGGMPHGSAKRPDGWSEYTVPPGHPMHKAWLAWLEATRTRDPEAWNRYRTEMAKARAHPDAVRFGWFERHTSAWDTPDDLYKQHVKKRLTDEEIAQRLGVSVEDARLIRQEWQQRHTTRADEPKWPDNDGTRLIRVGGREFASPDEARAWAENYRCEHCGGSGHLIDTPDDEPWTFMSVHKPGCTPTTAKAALADADQQDEQTSGQPNGGPAGGTEENPTGGNVSENGSGAPAPAPKYTDYTANGANAGGGGGGGAISAEDLFQAVHNYISAPVTRGAGEVIERLAAVASGIKKMGEAGSPLKVMFDEYHIDPAINESVESGFGIVSTGATTLTEGAERAKAFLSSWVETAKNSPGKVPDRALLEQDRAHA